MSKALKIYVAGKVSKESGFGTHYWRDDFVAKLEKLSGLKLINLDPTRKLTDQNNYRAAFGADVFMVSKADVIVVYFSNDISVGASQEILVAKYYKKPVIGLVPYGGKFHHANKEIFGQRVKDYRHPFVYCTCDVICDDEKEVAETLKHIGKINPKSIDLIKELAEKYEDEELSKDYYMKSLNL